MKLEYIGGGALIAFGLLFLFKSDRLAVTALGLFLCVMGGIALLTARHGEA